MKQDEHKRDADIVRAINRLSANTAKWLGIVAEAITQDKSDQAQVDALREKLKAQTNELETAVESATD